MNSAELNRLRWQCRRGMLEMDLLLERVLDELYSGFDADMRSDFERLLRCSDQDLQAWLILRQDGFDADLKDIIELIRKGIH